MFFVVAKHFRSGFTFSSNPWRLSPATINPHLTILQHLYPARQVWLKLHEEPSLVTRFWRAIRDPEHGI